MTRFPVLLLDHDDTVVRSTPEIHYPSWLAVLAAVRPDYHCSEQEFARYCFDPGFFGYVKDILHFSEEELATDMRIWTSYVERIVPSCYEGMADLIRRQKAEGGIVCVSTHSRSDFIERDYRTHIGFQPDSVYGLECGVDKVKPSPYAIDEIIKTYGVTAKDILMVDDMKPGFDMAKSRGVAFAHAAWSVLLPEILDFMRENADYQCKTVKDLSDILFS